MKKILIAEDDVLLSSLIEANLKECFEVFVAADGEDLLKKYNTVKPDIIILDIDMPVIDGLVALKVIRKVDTETRIIIITAFKDRWMIKEAMGLRVNAYLFKSEEGFEELNRLINGVFITSYPVLGPGVMQILYGESVIDRVEPTKREIIVLKLIIEGKTNREIAAILINSVHTICNHRKSLLRKFNVKNTAGLIKAARENKIYLGC